MISDAANGHSKKMISDAAVGRKPTGSFLGGMTENCRPLTRRVSYASRRPKPFTATDRSLPGP